MPNTVKISAAFTGLEESLRKALSSVAGSNTLKIPVNDKAFNSAVGGMTNNIRTFDKSLDYANRRVISFGASATIIYGTIRAFKELVTTTADVEKRITSMNAIFGLSQKNLTQFTKGLFDAARQTGQSFDALATAAEEFSRQGLSAQETLKRTRDAMILVRLTGSSTTEAVTALTVAMNTFGKTGLDTTQIINKLVAVDQNFAVSSKDLATALSRVGSVADDAGVSIDQLNGLITAAQQITGRGGPVIANALKTIFTRLERAGTLDQLEAMGIAVRDLQGNIRPVLQIFDELAKSYKNLGREQQQQVTQLAAGVFQANQFKALMIDLGKANGIAAQVTKKSADATNEAMVRNAIQNQTLAASFQNLKTTAVQTASTIGQLTLAPTLKGLTKGGTGILQTLFGGLDPNGATKYSENLGAAVMEGFLKGIGNVISGPGLMLAVRLAFGAVLKTAKEVTPDLGRLVQFGSLRTKEVESLNVINDLVAKGTEKEQQRFLAAKSVAEQEYIILGILERQLQLQGEVAMAGAAIRPGGGLRGGSRFPGAAEGWVGAMSMERSAISMGVGGAPASAQPVYLSGFNRGGGQKGIVANTSEFFVPGAAGGAIYNLDMIKKVGLPPGATPVAAGGYIPNAADGGVSDVVAQTLRRASPMFTPQVAGQDPIEVFRIGLTGLIKKGFDLSQLNLNVPEQELKKSVKNLIAGSLQISESDLKDPKVRAALNRVTTLTLEEQANRVAYYQAVQKQQATGDFRSKLFYSGVNAYGQRAIEPNLPSEVESAPSGSLGGGGIDYAAQFEEDLRYQEDLRRDRIMFAKRKQAQAEFDKARKIQSREKIANRTQMGLLGATLLTGFIPQGTSGEASGMASGAISLGVNAAASGAFAGSMFGPEGTIAGAVIGGIGGAIYGFISRSKKSFEELAAQLEEANAKSAEILKGASQYISLQSNIREAVEKGSGGTVINNLFRQQREAVSKLPTGIVRRLVEAGFDESKQTDILSELNQLSSEQTQKKSLAESIGLLGKGEPKSADISAVAASLRGSVSGDMTGIIPLLTQAREFGGNYTREFAPFRGFEGSMSAAAYDRNKKLDLLRTKIQDKLGSLIDQAGLDEDQKQTALTFIDKAKTGILVQFLKAFSQAGDNTPLLDIQQQANVQLTNLKQSFQNLLREQAGRISLNQTLFGVQQRSAAVRESGALSIGRGSLTAEGYQQLAGSVAVDRATREANFGNQQALATAKNEIIAELNKVNASPQLAVDVLKAGGVDALRGITDKVGGNEVKNKLAEIVDKLNENVIQNNAMISLAHEQTEVDKLTLQAEQRQTLLANGIYNQSNVLGVKSTLGALRYASGTTYSTNAISLSEQLTRLGIPQTEAGFGFEQSQRVVSSRDTIGAIRNALRGQSGPEADIINERLNAAEERLKFNPEAATRQLLKGNANPELLGQLVNNGQVSAATLVLKTPLDQLVSLDQEGNKFLAQVAANAAMQTDVQKEAALRLESIRLQGLANDPNITTHAQMGAINRLANVQAQIDAIDKKLANPVGYMPASNVPSALTTPPTQVEPGTVMMDKFEVKGGRRRTVGGPSAMLGTFSSGFGTEFERGIGISRTGDPVKDMANIKTAMQDLSAVGATVANSLQQNLGNAFGDFVTGAKSGKDAFKSFVVSVLSDAARAMASKAVVSLLMLAFSAYGGTSTAGSTAAGAGSTPATGGDFLPTSTTPMGAGATGGPMGLAGGGGVPVKVMGGEFIFGPKAARRLGGNTMRQLQTGMAGGGLVKGGSGVMDDVYGRLPAGSYVIPQASVNKYGAGNLAALANMAGGGYLSDMMPEPMGYATGGEVTPSASMMATPKPSVLQHTGGNSGVGSVNIGITINDHSTKTESKTEGNPLFNRQTSELLARRIKQITMETIEEQTRMGGILRPQAGYSNV